MNFPMDKYAHKGNHDMFDELLEKYAIPMLFMRVKCSMDQFSGHYHAEPEQLPDIAGKAFAVMRYSERDFEPVGYVAGLAGNAGTWEVILDRATALEQSDRLNDADDGCYYLAEHYTGE